MDFYNLFDFVTGIGCIIFAASFLVKKMFFLPERRLVFLFLVLGTGFILRGISQATHIHGFLVSERLVFTLFPLAATLYVEQMLKLRLNVFFKIFVIIGGLITLISLILLPHHFNMSQGFLTVYEGITLAYLMAKVLGKIAVSEGVERSIGIIILVFVVLTVSMIGVDYYRVNVLGLVRITSIIVFPFCYVAFLISYSGDGFSNRRAVKSIIFDVILAFTQTTILSYFIPSMHGSEILALGVALLYSRMIFQTVSMMMNSTESKKTRFALEKINRLSKVPMENLLIELKKIDNIKNARFVTKEDFELAGIAEAYNELSTGIDCFSRQKIETLSLRFEDDLDQQNISLVKYSLDAFAADYIFHIPKTNLCFVLKLERFNLDISLEERAYAIFNQARLAVYQNGGLA